MKKIGSIIRCSILILIFFVYSTPILGQWDKALHFNYTEHDYKNTDLNICVPKSCDFWSILSFVKCVSTYLQIWVFSERANGSLARRGRENIIQFRMASASHCVKGVLQKTWCCEQELYDTCWSTELLSTYSSHTLKWWHTKMMDGRRLRPRKNLTKWCLTKMMDTISSKKLKTKPSKIMEQNKQKWWAGCLNKNTTYHEIPDCMFLPSFVCFRIQ